MLVIRIYLVIGFILVKLLVIMLSFGFRLFNVVIIEVKVEKLFMFVVIIVSILIININV